MMQIPDDLPAPQQPSSFPSSLMHMSQTVTTHQENCLLPIHPMLHHPLVVPLPTHLPPAPRSPPANPPTDAHGSNVVARTFLE